MKNLEILRSDETQILTDNEMKNVSGASGGGDVETYNCDAQGTCDGNICMISVDPIRSNPEMYTGTCKKLFFDKCTCIQNSL